MMCDHRGTKWPALPSQSSRLSSSLSDNLSQVSEQQLPPQDDTFSCISQAQSSVVDSAKRKAETDAGPSAKRIGVVPVDLRESNMTALVESALSGLSAEQRTESAREPQRFHIHLASALKYCLETRVDVTSGLLRDPVGHTRKSAPFPAEFIKAMSEELGMHITTAKEKLPAGRSSV